jgi:23S rRNA pseudouridine2457 synthase
VLFNKPFDVLSQWTDDSGRQTLKNFIDIPDIYACGRLDRDSEGLLILTDNGKLQAKLSNPVNKVFKTYLAQVEGIAIDTQVQALCDGVLLRDGLTKPAKVAIIPEPQWLWERVPPIRVRQKIPTSWLSISICEGKNRQVRRMTAAVGLPTLRLVRVQIGSYMLEDLKSGEFRVI